MYVARGEHATEGGAGRKDPSPRLWYDREHRALSARQLRSMPRSAKLPFRAGQIPEPKQDRTRGARRLRDGARGRARRDKELQREVPQKGEGD